MNIDPAWVKGIRAWVKKTFAKKTYTDPQEVLQHILRLRDVELPRLKEYLLYNQGMLQYKRDSPEDKSLIDDLRDKVEEELKKARDALDEVKSRIKFQIDAATPGTWDAQQRPDVAKFYEERGPGSLLKGVAEIAQEALDEVDAALSGKLLRFVSNWLAKHGGGIAFEPDEVLLEYNVGNMKLVWDSAKTVGSDPRSPRDLKKYIPFVQKARALISRKGFDFLWYGTTFVSCKDCGGVIPYKMEQFGKAGGHYIASKDEITVFSDPTGYIPELLIHELGHRYYFKFMNSGDRARFDSFFGEIAPVSEYGGAHTVEDFAETFSHFILGRDLTHAQIERFRAFLSEKDRKRVASPARVAGAVRVADRFLSAKEWGDPSKIISYYRMTLARFQATFAEYGTKPHTELILSRDLVPVFNAARPLVEWVLQTRSIPPGKAKGIEMVARLFEKKIPKGIAPWYEKNKDRFPLLLEAAEWPERSSESEIAKAGPFTVHNTIGATSEQFKEIVGLVDQADRALHVLDFKKVAYGDVFVVGQLKQTRTVAWYNIAEDDVYVRSQAKKGIDDLRYLLHELGHRYWFKFMPVTGKALIYKLYGDLKYARVPVELPKVGEPIPMEFWEEPNPPTVTKIDHKFIYFSDGKGIKIDAYRKFVQIDAVFPSRYSATNEAEFFAECFAFFALGQLKPELKERFEAAVTKA